MLTFKEYTYLTEARAKDIIEKYPHLSELPKKHLSSYGEWLGKNIPPDADMKEVAKTIEGFHSVKDIMHKDDRDINSYENYDSLSKNVTFHLRKREFKNQQENAIVPVHESDNIKVNRVDTKEACIKNYGGGKTNWCVAATGKGNAFEHYRDANTEPGERNHMYTIHTPSGVYAYHEGEYGIARDSRDNEVSLLDLTEKHPELRDIPALKNSKYGKLFGDEDSLRTYMKKSPGTSSTSRKIKNRIVEGSEKLAHEFIDHPSDEIRAAAAKWESVADKYMNPGKGMFFTKKPEKSPTVLASIAYNHPEHAEVLYKHPADLVRSAAANHSHIAEKLLDNGEKNHFVLATIQYHHPDLWNWHPNGKEANMRK